MMDINPILLLCFASLLLSGCNKQIPTASCSSPETQALIRTNLIEQAVKLTFAKRYDQYEGSTVFGAVSVNNLLAQLQIAVANVKTTKEDPNSRQSLCSGQLQITVPPSLLADVDYAREAQHQPKIAQYGSQLSIEYSNNVFVQNVEYKAEYTLQSKGEGKDLHVDFESDTPMHLLDEIATAALLKPTLNVPEDDRVQLKQKVEPVKPEADKPSPLQSEQRLNKLNQELREEEQVQKKQSFVTKEQIPEQVTPQLAPPAIPAKQTAPSFDCSKAPRSTDIAVCTHPELVALDLNNMKLYVKAKSIDATATKAIFSASIKKKYACKANVDCIKQVYQKSIVNYGCIVAGKTSDCSAVPKESENKKVTK